MTRISRTAALTRAFWAIAAIEFLVALYVIVIGPFLVESGPIRVSASDASQPFRIATVAAAIAIWLADRRGTTLSWSLVPRWSRTAAAVASLVTVAVGLRWAVAVAGGADAFGYVSQASLWVAGDLVVPEPLAALDPLLARSAAPLGYIPAQVPAANVPVYSPGLPLLMALALVIGRSADAVYVVVPLLGGLAVWCTYLLGERLAGPRTGLLAALLTASSPLFLFHLFEPMSDLPVTAWWIASLTLALSTSPAAAMGSGLAAGAAILTRPNLAPLAAIVLLLVITRGAVLRRGGLFLAGVAPFCLLVAGVNQWLYGSPLQSGYGPLSLLFGSEFLWPNLQRYPRWLVDLHTIGILMALVAPFVPARSAERVRAGDEGVRDVRASWLLLAFCGGLLALYVFYIVFPDWPALRFLLPAVPVLFVLASAVTLRALALLPEAARGSLAFALCGLLGAWYVQKADRLGAFLIQESQQRYVTVGEFARAQLPPNAAYLALIQSGTMRWYGERPTLRWDQLHPEEFEQALATLTRHGFKPYLLVEDGETNTFRGHFGPASPLGQLDWPPAFELESQPRVRIYDPDDRARHVAGEQVVTRPILRAPTD